MKRHHIGLFLRLAMVVSWLAYETEFLLWNCYVKLSKELASTPMRLDHLPQESGAQVEQCLNLPVYPWCFIVTSTVQIL